MSQGKRRLRNESHESLWTQHDQTLRQLYEVERKTLKQVKTIMESEHDFPDLPLSIYETRLRDGLRLRKKFNNSDWPIIYEHFHKRKERGKESALYLNKVQIPRNKVWKEIRRSGNTVAYQGQHSPRPLPAHITVRTPSPAPQSIATVDMNPAASLSSNLVPVSFASLLSSLPVKREHLATIPNWLLSMAYNGPLPEETLEEYSGWVHRLCLESIPIRIFLIKSAGLFNRDSQISECPNGDNDDQQESFILKQYVPQLGSRLIDVSLRSIQRISSLDSLPQLRPDFTVVRDFNTYHYLTKMIYLLSNGLHSTRDGEILELIVNRVPRKALDALFAINTPSIRSAWHSLVKLAYKVDHRNAFKMLVAIGLERHEWIRPYRKQYLKYASSMGCISTVRGIVKSSDCPNRDIQESDSVITAIRNHNTECARLLVDYIVDTNCSTNVAASIIPEQSYLKSLLCRYVDLSHAKLSSESDMYSQALQMILDSGVHIDFPWTPNFPGFCNALDSIELLHFANHMSVSDKRRLTLVEACFYLDEALFQRISGYSSRSATDVTRHGICLAARRGKDALDQYLRSRSACNPEEVAKFLQLVLAEQFLLDGWRIDIQGVKGLVACGVDIGLPALKIDLIDGKKVDTSFLLGRLVEFISRYGLDKDVEILLELLLLKGAVVSQETLCEAVRGKEGLCLLPLLLPHAIDMARDASAALVTAAEYDNFGAVDWLLESGVDINTVYTDGRFWPIQPGYSVLAVACTSASIKMVRHLMERGAKPRVNCRDEDLTQFLHFALRRADWHDSSLPDKIRLSVGSGIDLRNASISLLEACLAHQTMSAKVHHRQLDFFEWLYRKGAPLRPGSPLAMLICKQGRRDLVHELIGAGADINAYSKERTIFERSLTPLQAAALIGDEALVRYLCDKGANINSPAKGTHGRTALQAACGLQPLSAEEEIHKRNIIRFLIDRGADVNADTGRTSALESAAMIGDIETVVLLLRHCADVNAPRSRRSKPDYLTLDWVAFAGRLDMVKFLLNEGAQSYEEGSTGYDGAIKAAEKEGHFPIADLIHQHVASLQT